MCYTASDKLIIKTICYQKSSISEATAGTVTPVGRLYRTDSMLRTQRVWGLQRKRSKKHGLQGAHDSRFTPTSHCLSLFARDQKAIMWVTLCLYLLVPKLKVYVQPIVWSAKQTPNRSNLTSCGLPFLTRSGLPPFQLLPAFHSQLTCYLPLGNATWNARNS